MLDLFQNGTFSIDPRSQQGAFTPPELSFRMGTSSLPSLETLRNRVALGGRRGIQDLPNDSVLYFLDTETTGAARSDIIRSISMRETRLSNVSGVAQISDPSPGNLGARFVTAQMASLPAADPSDLTRTISFADAVIKRETHFGTPAARGLTDKIFDLTSSEGRVSAANYYQETFRRLTQDNAYLVAYNARFDAQKLMDSASSLGEFMDNPESRQLLEKLQQKIANGGVIDIFEMAKTRLTDKLSARLSAAGDDSERRALLGIESLLSPRALGRAQTAGEAVKPFGLENLVESSNLLTLMARSGTTEEMEIINTLASGASAHIDVTDETVARLLFKHMQSLDLNVPGAAPDFSGLDPSVVSKIQRGQLNIASARAMVSTVNLSDPRYLTENVLGHMMNVEEAFQRIEVEAPLSAIIGGAASERGTLRYDPSSGQYKFISPRSGLNAPIEQTVERSTAEGFIRREIAAVRSLAPDASLEGRQAIISTLGISPIQQANIEYTNRFLTSNINSRIATGSISQISTSIGENEEAFFRAMSATGNVTGFSAETAPDGSGFLGRVRGAHQIVGRSSREAYVKALYEGGVSSASLNPELRSAVVSLSAMTSEIGAKNQSLLKSLFPEIADAEELQGRVSAAEGLVARNIRSMSDIGITHMKTQKTLSVGESVIALPFSVLKQMKTLDESGNQIDFLNGLGQRSSRVRLSVAARERGVSVNAIFGGSLGQRMTESQARVARVEAESAYAAVRGMVQGKSPEAMVQEGLAASRSQALSTLASVQDKERFVSSYMERGFIGATLEASDDVSENTVQNVARVVQEFSGGVDNDLIAVQRGLVMNAAQMDEDSAAFAIRMSDEAMQEAQRAGQAGVDLMARSSAGSQLDILRGALRRGVDDPEFFGRLRSFLSRAEPSEDLASARPVARRAFRDASILEKMDILKPKIYKGAIGVAALSAGYYLARRGSQNQAFEEVMERQPTEQGPLSIKEFNDLDQTLASQTSSRRDPLVTAGVVGNLDRNKSNHHKMGSDKYNHLFGA
jgi:hypothetical protein